MGASLIPPSPTTPRWPASCRLTDSGTRAALMAAAHPPHLTLPGPRMHGRSPGIHAAQMNLYISCAVSQELPKQSALQSLEFQIVALLGGLLGFGISFTSLW